MTLAILMQRMMLGGQAAAPLALNFNGSDIYGEFTHPYIFTGDFGIVISFKTTDTVCSLTSAINTYSTRLQVYIDSGGTMGIWHATTLIAETLAAVNDGLDHVAVIERAGAGWTLTLDEVPQDTGSGSGDVSIERVGQHNSSQWFNGQIPSIGFIDKSGAEDVTQLFILNNGSTTSIPIFGGGAEEMTLHGVDAGDWS
ncbi:MAG: hypothetical protein GY937_17570 [bacterium]|nr:hypothetical protein [bacterium]